MRFAKSATALAATGLVFGGATIAATAHDRDDHKRDPVVVEAPTTRVVADKDRTKVQVRAPFADVDVDTDRRRVRIDVPFFNGEVRW